MSDEPFFDAGPYSHREGTFEVLARMRYRYPLAGQEPADVASELQGTFEEIPGVLMDVLRTAFDEGDLELSVMPARNTAGGTLDDVLLREHDVPDLDVDEITEITEIPDVTEKR